MKHIKYLIICFLIIQGFTGTGQKYFTREGKVSFFSKAPLEDIEAQNDKATAVIDFSTGEMEWAVLIKAFKFEKALMQEHFNENYMESSKFPKAIFKGKFQDYKKIDFNKDGTWQYTVSGSLTIHGVSQEISAPVTITTKNSEISGSSQFSVKVQDYEIEIPAIVRDKIAKEINVKVESDFQSLDRL